MIPRPWQILSLCIQCSTLDGCGSTLHPGYLYQSGALVHNALAPWTEFPAGVRTRIHLKFCTSPGWVPWAGSEGFIKAAAMSADGHRHAILLRWNICPYFPPCLQFYPWSPWNYAILPPIEYTIMYIVFGPTVNWSNACTSPCPNVTVTSCWGYQQWSLTVVPLPWRT